MDASNAPPDADEPRLPVVFAVLERTHTSEGGVSFFARLECPTLGLDKVYAAIVPATGELALMLPCGCRVSTRIVPMLVQLAAMQGKALGDGGLH